MQDLLLHNLHVLLNTKTENLLNSTQAVLLHQQDTNSWTKLLMQYDQMLKQNIQDSISTNRKWVSGIYGW